MGEMSGGVQKVKNILTPPFKVYVRHTESPACIYVQLVLVGKDGLDK